MQAAGPAWPRAHGSSLLIAPSFSVKQGAVSSVKGETETLPSCC